MKNSKEKDLKLKEKELKANPSAENAEALEADRELNPEELDGVSGGSFKDWLKDPDIGPFSKKK